MDQLCFNCFNHRGDYQVCPHCGHIDGTPNQPAYLLQPKTMLWGRYLIGSCLGIGGFGITYKAFDIRLNTIIAIKEFFPTDLASRIAGETKVRLFSGEKIDEFMLQKGRFLDEGKSLARFTGEEHIVNVFDTFEDNNTAYIVMEFLDGLNLKDYLQSQGGSLAPDEALSLLNGILKGIEAIHAKGIIHRDISPDNLYILQNGQIKILDFGAARFAAKEEWTQNIVIKKGYAPPEQYRQNMRQTELIDLYAAGATYYKMLTGLTPDESIDRAEKDMLKRPSAHNNQLDNNTDKFVMKAMALKTDLRFKNATEMRQALTNYDDYDFPENEQKKRRFRRTVMALSAGLLLLIALFVAGRQISQIGRVSIDNSAYQLANMDLAAETITVWDYDLSIDLDTAALAFMQKYPQHQINIVNMYDDFDYDKMQAINQYQNYGEADAPDISSYHLWQDESYRADFRPLVNSLVMDDYYLLGDYYRNWPADQKISEFNLSFHYNVFVTNAQDLNQRNLALPETINSLEQVLALYDYALANQLADDYNVLNRLYFDINSYYQAYLPPLYDDGLFSPNQDWQEQFALLAELKYILFVDNKDMVHNDEAYIIPYHVSRAPLWFDEYDTIIPVMVDDKLIGEFTDQIYINGQISENKQLVAMLFVEYLLSEEWLYADMDNDFAFNKNYMDDLIASDSRLAAIKPYLEQPFAELQSDGLYFLPAEQLRDWMFDTLTYDHYLNAQTGDDNYDMFENDDWDDALESLNPTDKEQFIEDTVAAFNDFSLSQ